MTVGKTIPLVNLYVSYLHFLVRLHHRPRHQAHHPHRALPDHQLTDAEEEIEVVIDEDLLSEGNFHKFLIDDKVDSIFRRSPSPRGRGGRRSPSPRGRGRRSPSPRRRSPRRRSPSPRRYKSQLWVIGLIFLLF